MPEPRDQCFRFRTGARTGERCENASRSSRDTGRRLACVIIAVLATGSSAMRGSAEEDVLVGRSAGGQLKVEIGFSLLGLEASVFPGITGYATGAVGFHSAAFDDPTNDFFQFHTDAAHPGDN
jgi:hypothetical protein